MAPPSKSGRRKPATLADVGKIAGVSAMAASAVLNQTKTSARISEETQKRIRKAAAELNYRPNIAARALVQRRMNTIGVFIVVDEKELNHYFLEVFNGIIDGASKYDQNVTVFTLHTWEDAREKLESAFDGRIDGMILIAPVITPEFSKALHTTMPFVALHANAEVEGLINLEADEEKGAMEMVRLLLAEGHRRIMHISGPRGLVGVERRIRGYRAALAEGGLTLDPSLLLCSSYNAPGGRKAIRTWLRENEQAPLPDAIFCANDAIALGCMEALAEKGIRTPEDVSVCGFDDSFIARATVPQLTTVRQPLRQMGVEAVSILINRIVKGEQHDHLDRSPIVFPTEVIRRASVAPRI